VDTEKHVSLRLASFAGVCRTNPSTLLHAIFQHYLVTTFWNNSSNFDDSARVTSNVSSYWTESLGHEMDYSDWGLS